MAKESGLGFTVAVDNSSGQAKTISNDIVSLTISTPRAMQDISGIDKSAMERLQLRADGQVGLNGIFNDEADKSHDVFKTVPSTAVARTTTLTVSAQILAMELLFGDYGLSMGADGAFTWSTSGQLANGTAPSWTT